MKYVGRFAPSPTGPLHAGSLLTAAASFLHARQAGGEWLVRIEDVDPPREVAGAADAILNVLDAMDLEWDRSVLYQSTRFDVYAAIARELLEQGLAFRCRCSRSELQARATGGAARRYPGTCRNRGIREAGTAIRMRVDGEVEPLVDGLQGPLPPEALTDLGDYVIWRRDGLPAYHLAVVVDDDYQGVTTIVRGKDLLESTAAQRHLQRALAIRAPAYFHVPVVETPQGEKLSKQTGARAVELGDRSAVAASVLSQLGAVPPESLRGARPRELWEWAIASWRIDALTGVTALREEG